MQPPCPIAGFQRAICVDGTTFKVADTPANEARYGRPPANRKESAFPAMRAMMALDAATGAFIAENHGNYNDCSEASLLEPMLGGLARPGTIILGDRGIYSFDRVYRLYQAGAHVLMRIKANIKVQFEQALPDGSYLGLIRESKPPKGQKKRHLLVRIVEYTVGDGTKKASRIRLLTTFLNYKVASAMDLAAAYHVRWRVEGGLCELKALTQDFGEPHLPGRSVESVEQEFAALLTAHSLVRLLMARVAAEKSMDPMELSLTGSMNTLTNWLLIRQRQETGGLTAADWRNLLEELARQRLPDRERPNYPRATKSGRSKFPRRSRDQSPTPPPTIRIVPPSPAIRR